MRGSDQFGQRFKQFVKLFILLVRQILEMLKIGEKNSF